VTTPGQHLQAAVSNQAAKAHEGNPKMVRHFVNTILLAILLGKNPLSKLIFLILKFISSLLISR
jgi:hypothetical protein